MYVLYIDNKILKVLPNQFPTFNSCRNKRCTSLEWWYVANAAKVRLRRSKKRPHGRRRPPRLAVRAASKCRQIEQGPFSSHQGCNNRTTKILSDCLQIGLFLELTYSFFKMISYLPSERYLREIKIFTYSAANLNRSFNMVKSPIFGGNNYEFFFFFTFGPSKLTTFLLLCAYQCILMIKDIDRWEILKVLPKLDIMNIQIHIYWTFQWKIGNWYFPSLPLD